jgi:hypothetical protein
MVMLTLDEARTLYEFCGATKIQYHRVDHPTFNRFSRSSRRFFAMLGESAADPFWSEFVRAVRRYRFAAAASPLPLNDPAIFPRLDPEQLRLLVNRATVVYPTCLASLKELTEFLSQLRTCTDNPLIGPLEAAASVGRAGRTGVIIADSRLIGRTREVLGSCASTAAFDVLSVAQARDALGCERLIALGAASWFPDHVFSAPRAPELMVVAYRWIRSRWHSSPAFTDGRLASASQIDHGEADPDDAMDEPSYATDWSEVTAQAIGGTEASEAPDTVDARTFVLHGGQAVLLDTADGAYALVIDLEADEDSRVQRVPAGNVQPGMFLLLRTEGGGDYIAPVANRILGPRADPCRAAQRDWKERLRTEVRRTTLFQGSLRLVELGSKIADEQNLRNWMWERSICTRDKEDFAAIMRLVGLDDKTDLYWSMMGEIRRAHRQAGARIRRQLLAQVKTADLDRLRREGQLNFVLPDADGGKLTALRVEARSPSTVGVPESRVGRPFLLGG